MAETFDLIIKGGTCVSHRGRALADIGIRDGKIAAFGDLFSASADRVIDATGLHVLPGVIDTQVHFREPGPEHKEDLESGSRGAVLGGVTGVFEMPNTSPPTITRQALEDKVKRGTHRMWCDFAFYAGAASENAAQLGELEMTPGCCGVKMFMGASTGDLLVFEDEAVFEVLRHGRRRLAVHSEDEFRMRERAHLIREGDVHSHREVRDVESAVSSTKRLLALARKAGRRVHVLHITTADEMPILAANKDICSVEVTPQHLTLFAPDCYDRLGSKAQMNPPIREQEHREGLWAGLRSGIVDVIGSDHAPHTLEEKAKPYPQSPSGMTGVQTLVPIMLTHVNEGRLTLEHFVDLTSAGPQRLFGLRDKGRLALGYDADITLVDMSAEREITDDWIASKSGWTPYAGMTAKGWPVGTIVRGHQVMWEDQLLGTAVGEAMRFQDTITPER